MAKSNNGRRRPFTEPLTPDEKKQVRERVDFIRKAHQDDSKTSSEENWNEAIEQLRHEHSFPGRRIRIIGGSIWRLTGLKGKTLWDLAEVLVVPLTLTGLGFAFQYYSDQRDAQQQEAIRQREEQLAEGRNNQATLMKYFDDMGTSLNNGLLTSKPGDDRFIVAQAKTVVTIQSLDRRRQQLVIQFLSASGLNKTPDEQNESGDTELVKEDNQGNVLGWNEGSWALFYKAQMAKADFRGSDLSGAVLVGVDLLDSNFSCRFPDKTEEFDRQCSDLSVSNLSGARLSGANLSNADLGGANLYEADLFRANLSGANLGYTDLRDANLNGSNLADAILGFADLSGALLQVADLSNATLDRVTLSNAYLEDVNFQNAILLKVDLRTSEYLELEQLTSSPRPFLCATKLPPGMEHLSDRDCDRLPHELWRRFPEQYETVEKAERFVESRRNE